MVYAIALGIEPGCLEILVGAATEFFGRWYEEECITSDMKARSAGRLGNF